MYISHGTVNSKQQSEKKEQNKHPHERYLDRNMMESPTALNKDLIQLTGRAKDGMKPHSYLYRYGSEFEVSRVDFSLL